MFKKIGIFAIACTISLQGMGEEKETAKMRFLAALAQCDSGKTPFAKYMQKEITDTLKAVEEKSTNAYHQLDGCIYNNDVNGVKKIIDTYHYVNFVYHATFAIYLKKDPKIIEYLFDTFGSDNTNTTYTNLRFEGSYDYFGLVATITILAEAIIYDNEDAVATILKKYTELLNSPCLVQGEKISALELAKAKGNKNIIEMLEKKLQEKK